MKTLFTDLTNFAVDGSNSHYSRQFSSGGGLPSPLLFASAEPAAEAFLPAQPVPLAVEFGEEISATIVIVYTPDQGSDPRQGSLYERHAA